MQPRQLTVATIQQPGFANREDSFRETEKNVRHAKQQGAQIVLLQELHASYYFCQSENPDFFQLAETIPGPTSDFLSQLANELQLIIIGSVFEKRSHGLYHNTAVVFDTDGTLAGKYRKMHIPDDPGYYEKYYFTPGDLGFTPVQTSLAKIGVLVCWDQWYPEAARLMTLAGAEMLCYPTAIGWFPGDDKDTRQRCLDSWITIQRSHSVANCLPVLSANRVGLETDPSGVRDGIEFWGNSFITGTHGELLAHASTETQVLTANIQLNDIETTRQIWPYLRDRRIDAYADLTKRFRD